ncbi:CDAN1-interacting nuclease 1 [Caerostris extrusa]|uniref:CDAN1-interacting nuclease 1 n=1 Tax=Caerostris extrusa TaxID=172846 RepID=A0AAV4XEE0_CAEEX|nr:CDAN1-interacting nuclease 1 [Caerostris extrusa]
MRRSYYKRIIKKYCEINKYECLEELCAAFPDVPQNTMESIIDQECQKKARSVFHYHSEPENAKNHYESYLERRNNEQCGVILKMAEEIDLSPALLMKIILNYHFNTYLKEKDPNDHKVVEKSEINELMVTPSLIEDYLLAAEVKLITFTDKSYGPVADTLRNCKGVQFENILKRDLKNLGLIFTDEKTLREKGFDKTPDIRLDIPIAINNRVINWIESKASFGDEERHFEYLKKQYWDYYRRFGPGLVIYWDGFVDEINNNKKQGVIVRDRVPAEVTYMDPLSNLNTSWISEDLFKELNSQPLRYVKDKI